MSRRPTLYSLIPAIYRWRDEQQGEPLRALMEVFDSQLDALEANMDALWDNWFIETCAPWVVPYLGELVGVQGIETDQSNVATQRARVADTLWSRSRKGHGAILGNAAGAASGWPTVAVNALDGTAATQLLQAVNVHRGGTADLENRESLAFLASPWNTIAHSVDVRDIASPGDAQKAHSQKAHQAPDDSAPTYGSAGTSQRASTSAVKPTPAGHSLFTWPYPGLSEASRPVSPGTAGRPPRSAADPPTYGPRRTARGFGPDNLLLWAYLLRGLAVRSATPYAVGDPRSGIPDGVPCTIFKPPFVLQNFTFDAAGASCPLFTVPDSPNRLAERLKPAQVPQPISRKLLAHDLAQWDLHGPSASEFFGLPPQIAITVYWRRPSEPGERGKRHRTVLDPTNFVVADLSRWQPPAAWVTRLILEGQAHREMPWGAAIDPVLGRFLLAGPVLPRDVEVDYGQGRGDALGSGAQPSDPGRVGEARRSDRLFRVSRPLSKPERAAFVAERERPAADRRLFAKPKEALAAWRRSRRTGAIEFIDSATYKLDGELVIDLRRRRDDAERAEPLGERREEAQADDDVEVPSLVISAVPGERPHLEGDLRIQAGAAAVSVMLHGLSISGTVRVVGNVDLRVSYCTIQGRPENRGAASLVYVSSEPSIAAEFQQDFAPLVEPEPPLPQLRIQNSLVNAVSWATQSPVLSVADSVVNGHGSPAITGPVDLNAGRPAGPRLHIERTTVFGEVSVLSLQKSLDTLFADQVFVINSDDRQVSHTWAAPGSIPDITSLPGVNRQEAAGLAVVFESKTLCNPSYSRLSQASSTQILEGGSGNGELGVFHRLDESQRRRNVMAVLDAYLPMGMKAAIFVAPG